MTKLGSESVHVSIARDFTTAPGFRFRTDGEHSGEEFRETFLEPHFIAPSDESIVTINFDGVAGYATSFLEEAFGGLARTYGQARCLRKLELISEEEPLLIEEITGYINEAG